MSAGPLSVGDQKDLARWHSRLRVDWKYYCIPDESVLSAGPRLPTRHKVARTRSTDYPRWVTKNDGEKGHSCPRFPGTEHTYWLLVPRCIPHPEAFQLPRCHLQADAQLCSSEDAVLFFQVRSWTWFMDWSTAQLLYNPTEESP